MMAIRNRGRGGRSPFPRDYGRMRAVSCRGNRVFIRSPSGLAGSRWHFGPSRCLLILTLGLSLSGLANAEGPLLPIFDAHIHYNQHVWDALRPEEAIERIEAAGITRALVSSTPDDGTLKLHALAPDRIVPILRPYRSAKDRFEWTNDPDVQAYVEARLAQGPYKGIGEFHLLERDVGTAVVRRFAELAVDSDLVLHAHVDAPTVTRLAEMYPRARILWAHAGMDASPETVGNILARFPDVWVELSLRFDVSPNGKLDPAWRRVFVAHPTRFLVGTDTWVAWRWEVLSDEARFTREWLNQLPRAVAERIAHRNGEALLGE